MRIGLYAFAAVALLAVTLPASAEEFRFRAGGDGVGVRVGGDHEGRREGWREGRRDHDCRTIVIKKRTPDGVVIKKIRKCD
jgi:hypothetical protein